MQQAFRRVWDRGSGRYIPDGTGDRLQVVKKVYWKQYIATIFVGRFYLARKMSGDVWTAVACPPAAQFRRFRALRPGWRPFPAAGLRSAGAAD